MTATAPRVLRGSFIALACGMATPVAAQQVPVPVPMPTAGSPQKPTKRAAAQPTGDEITVTGWRLRELDTVAPTASRLNLSIRETPATLDRIGADEMLTRGFRTVEEATDSLPGIISGGSPRNPTLFSMRGFTGEQVTILHNGQYLGPANMINRPGNTFNIGVTVTVLMPGPVDTEFMACADFLDIVGGQGPKADPADVAKAGYNAMLAGTDHIISRIANKVMAAVTSVIPSPAAAALHARMPAPGSGKDDRA